MAIIYQQHLFSWKDSKDLGDLDRLKMVLDLLPDEELVTLLEKQRKNGRNDYPIRPMWNAIIALQIYQHPTTASLIRELKRNGQLRELCGFDPIKGVSAVPSEFAFSRFYATLEKHQKHIDHIFSNLVDCVGELLPDLGECISVDSESLNSLARGRGKPNSTRDIRAKNKDRRKENDADWGKKFILSDSSGEAKKIAYVWFGFKLHLLVDATHELPIAYEVTRASCHDRPLVSNLLNQFSNEHSKIFYRCKYLTADRAYDDCQLITHLWKNNSIKSVIATRDMWKKGDKDRPLKTFPEIDNITYDQKGNLFCYCPSTYERCTMPLAGFETDRDTIKFRCPAKQHQFECPGRGKCRAKNGIRIPLKEDRRVFTPLPRNSRNWDLQYKKRTTVERVFSRLDTSYGYDKPKIKGLARFVLKISMSLIVMLSMAIGRVQRKELNMIRSLVQIA